MLFPVFQQDSNSTWESKLSCISSMQALKHLHSLKIRAQHNKCPQLHKQFCLCQIMMLALTWLRAMCKMVNLQLSSQIILQQATHEVTECTGEDTFDTLVFPNIILFFQLLVLSLWNSTLPSISGCCCPSAMKCNLMMYLAWVCVLCRCTIFCFAAGIALR